MQYTPLRDLGIQHVQELAGKIWTDYNTHDPGVTILEVLAYAITDLGYRVNQDIRDIIAQDPTDPDKQDILNFFTAAKILPVRPLTITDIRKVIMDVSVYDAGDGGCEFVGVKNAWVSISDTNEFPVYAHTNESILSYEPPPSNPAKAPLAIKPLYNVLLEFESCDTYGDLNENELTDSFTVLDSADEKLEGLVVKVEVDFPRWDEEGIDWQDLDSIRNGIQNITVQFHHKPRRYEFSYKIEDDKTVVLKATKPGTPDPEDVPEMVLVSADLNDFIYNNTDGLIVRYQKKVAKILKILAAVKATLHANRNLCEDYYKFQALKIEEIALCADIELELEADVEEVQAQIYYHIGRFLSPTVPYYSLQEMLDQGIPVEDIYEGPLLNHGFLLDEDVIAADRRDVIHVSDLIQIIMDVEGVVAVRKIEIANFPQDNDDNIPSKSVKWCLDLALEYNYIPRLSVTDSKVTYYKDQLPYQADQTEVDERIAELQEGQASQKIQNPVLDLKVPYGQYLQLEDYTSIQEEFPITYGIGSEGLPSEASDERKAQAKQLKGFLMFFDQLFADYLAQLAHVKDLFSMNAEKDEEGKYIINRTYFTQVLKDIVPNADPLYVDIDTHPEHLDAITETEEAFVARRNKFLNHLMARFAEQFTDYATLTYRLAGLEGGRDLLQDKLTFLNHYPEISAGRHTAFNYREPCKLWHIENKSGLEKRAALTVGVDDRFASELQFSAPFEITTNGSNYGFTIGSPVLMTAPTAYPFSDRDAAALALEEVLINGVVKERYEISGSPGAISFTLSCDEGVIAKSKKTDYADVAAAEADIAAAMAVIENEFYFNPESNRNNLTAPVDNYFEVDITVDMVPTIPTYTISYKLHSEAFSTDPGDVIMTGTYEGEAEEGMTQLEVENVAQERAVDFIWDVVSNGVLADQYSFDPPETPFTSPYRLLLTGRLGGELGASEEFDFNDAAADAFNALTTQEVLIAGAGANDGLHAFTSASADGPYVHLQMPAAMPATTTGGILTYTDAIAFTADTGNNAFVISGDYTTVLYNVDEVTIDGSGYNNGTYQIREVAFDGTDTTITVKETLGSSNSDGTLSYPKAFNIYKITGSKVTVYGGLDGKALQDLVDFFKKVFFSNEGFHLVEHILLRPKVHGWHFIPLTDETLIEGLAVEGVAFFERIRPILSCVKSTKIFRVAGDATNEIMAGLTIQVTGMGDNDDGYTVTSATYVPGDDLTEVKVSQSVEETITEPKGNMSYHVTLPVDHVVAAEHKVVLTGETTMDAGTVLHITGSSDANNDGKFEVTTTNISGTDTEVVLASKEGFVEDRLLPVNLDADCIFCQLENPYTYIASVILPYWQGRFTNADFRKFFERKIRLEAPAHIFLTICWVSNAHMAEFEEMYKRWLLENARDVKDPVQLSIALNNLIDIMSRIRNVYPVGRLHDCEESATTENSIILNNSILGNA